MTSTQPITPAGALDDTTSFFRLPTYALTPAQDDVVQALTLGALSRRAGYWLAILLGASVGAAAMAVRDGTARPSPGLPLPTIWFWAFGIWLLAIPYAFLLRRTIGVVRALRTPGHLAPGAAERVHAMWIAWCALSSLAWMLGAWCLLQPPFTPGSLPRFSLGMTTFLWLTALGHVLTMLFLSASWKALLAAIVAGMLLPLWYVASFPPANLRSTGFLVNWLGGQAVLYCLIGWVLYRNLRHSQQKEVWLEDETKNVARERSQLIEDRTRADRARALAEEERSHAVEARRLAEEARGRAEEERARAVEARTQAEEERTRAEKASRDKNTFIASISHDLRQPLSALSMSLSSLDANLRGDARAADIVATAKRQAVAIEGMVNGALDLSRLEAGTWKVDVRAVPLPDLIEDVVDSLRSEARAKNLRIAFRAPSYLVRTDHHALARILRNFVGNAIRYTPGRAALDGSRHDILVACQKRGERMRISVFDRGIGIPEERFDDIFEEYVQLDNAERDRTKGFGLGLAIVRGLARLLDHELERPCSRVGHGSRFSLLVPIVDRLYTPAQAAESDGPGQLDMTVVVVEDDADVRHALGRRLREFGCQVIDGENAQEVITQLRDEDPPIRPDFLISDYRLRRGSTGIDAIAAIRAATSLSLPAVIYSGETDPEILKTVAAQGIEMLPKPIRESRLVALMSRHQPLRRDPETILAT